MEKQVVLRRVDVLVQGEVEDIIEVVEVDLWAIRDSVEREDPPSSPDILVPLPSSLLVQQLPKADVQTVPLT
jgi:hypothetical protein